MNIKVKNLTVVGVLASFLVLASGYLASFQNWLVFSQTAPLQPSLVSSPVLSSGIRAIAGKEVYALGQHNDKNITGLFSSQQSSQSMPSSKPQKQDSKQFALRAQKTPQVAAQEVSAKHASHGTKPAKNLSLPADAVTLTEPYLVELADELLIKFPARFSQKAIKKAISRVLVMPESPDAENILAQTPINTRLKPHYYNKVLNQQERPIRYPGQAYQYADYLLKNHSQTILEQGQNFVLVQVPLHNKTLPLSVKTYQSWVNQYAQQFDVAPELVFAIIQTESAFNPKAVSKSNALGLMQIKPKAAGKDVYHLIDKRSGYPSTQALFDPQENIRVGVGYMGLLKNKYLKKVRHPQSREMLLISAYNGGLSKALKLFGDTPEAAIERINQLYPRNIYRALRTQHESDETRRYLDKVLAGKEKFSQIILSSA